MLEIKLTVEAPELTGALNNLADALRARPAYGVTTTVMDSDVAAAVEAATAAVTSAAVEVSEPVAEVKAPQPEAKPAAPAEESAAATYTMEDITRAGSQLLDCGKMDDLMKLLAEHGVQAVTQLKPEQFAAVAGGLRALGATI